MSRDLRPRTKQQNYHHLNADLGDEPDEHAPQTADSMDVDDAEFMDDAVIPETRSKTRKAPSKKKGKLKTVVAPTPSANSPGDVQTATKQSHALPTPSYDHRHRASPLFRHTGQTERLIDPPQPFTVPATTTTPNWTTTSSMTDRINKAMAYSIGWGPFWEYIEDRGWWKESVTAKGHEWKESSRRPRVYIDIKLDDDWVLLTDQATEYLPQNDDSGVGPNSVTCQFGPFAGQCRRTLNTFDTFRMSEYLPESNAHVFYPGAPVWGLDWCPILASDSQHRSCKQYLAVSPFPSLTHAPIIGKKSSIPACIQIWSVSADTISESTVIDGEDTTSAASRIDIGRMFCELVMCIESGTALELKWCPLPSNDLWTEGPRPATRKLGLLAGAFEDGTLSIFVVPDPEDMKTQGQPAFFKPSKPILRYEFEDSSIMCLDWANSETIVCGCSNGSIAVFNVRRDLDGHDQSLGLLPTHYIPLHQSAVSTVRWVRAPQATADGGYILSDDPTIVFSGGYDGCQMLTDLREGCGHVMNRTRDVITAATYSNYTLSPISVDHDFTVKIFAVSPEMLGRGHTILDTAAVVQTLHASDLHSHLAIGCADGSCITTNSVRAPRRSNLVPFFYHKIYQMDYSRQTGEWRMLEQFLPKETSDKQSNTKKKVKGVHPDETVSSPAWPETVGVLRVVWNQGSGLAQAPFLASSTASGICRVDWLLGRLINGKTPYGGVQYVRGEVEGNSTSFQAEDSEEESD